MIAHLIYHVAPIDHPLLRVNLDWLARYWINFNGKRVIHVGRQEGWLDFDAFKTLWKEAGLPVDGVSFVQTDNDPEWGETRPFIEELLPRVESTQSGEITFYAHAKGVSRPLTEPIRKWVDFLYVKNLGNLRRVQSALSRHPVAGVLKISHPMGPLKAPWHYSGSFFWFRNSDLFQKDWRRIPPGRYGVEAYPAEHFPGRQACCLACPLSYPYLDLYDRATWAKIERGGGRLYSTRLEATLAAKWNLWREKKRNATA